MNEATVDLAYKDAMQFGNALRQLLLQIQAQSGPAMGPRVSLQDRHCQWFQRQLHQCEQREALWDHPARPDPLVLFFLALPMGWVSSPPVFSVATESVTGVTNAKNHGGKNTFTA